MAGWLNYITCEIIYIMRKIILMDNKKENQEQKHDPQNTREKKNNTESIKEIGGPKGPEPTRYGDWERRGRCIDF
jgi:hypothetical protein